ncbi:(d)CMP kinase [Blastopirellula marina]|uniref:Cytidylate kinase n=1 Tax=Blastopirellula marina TaxID=124 RepID=A0A2S8GA71_9BACT|nr:(d)CMP kinase [Blastopirellula marina]PQO35466.1 (d)CMP kinase [Blastopirellula marina]PQO41362.1 (d)CMP kinase [Blastopirellula marina]PTL44106.1 (d)CMP kinase [Blastopirellula marina]
MIVTIDGPAGAGKSSISRQVAEQLGFEFLDTGAMYRAVAWAVLRQNRELTDASAVAEVAQRLRIDLSGGKVLVDGEDATAEIRTPEVTQATRYAASNVEVRAHLVELQQQFGREKNLVTEGRDQGTVVFPHAECKIYLTASPEERARRRVADLAARGVPAEFDDILAQQNRRDEEDSSREVGPLRKADDAVELCTDGMTPDEVIQRLIEIVEARKASL